MWKELLATQGYRKQNMTSITSSMILMTLVLVVCFARFASPSFDCRRRGQTCQNGGECPDARGNCTCVGDYEGYDCSIQKNLTDSTCNCANEGTCISNGTANITCLCTERFYGKNCSLQRYQVRCEAGSLLIGINPYGDFQGQIYISSNITSCKFGNIRDVNSNKTDGWVGFGKKVDNTDDNCTRIDPVVNPAYPANGTDDQKSRNTTYTRVVYVVYETTFMTSLDEILTFTCVFDTNNVAIYQESDSIAMNVTNLQRQTHVAELSPVQFTVTANDVEAKTVDLGEDLKFEFKIDSTSFDRARLETCVINDTLLGGHTLTVVDNGCVTKDAKPVLSKTIQYSDDNVTITLGFTLRAFKFIDSDLLGIMCQVKVCPVGSGERCMHHNCTDDSAPNQMGYGRRKRAAESTRDVGLIINVRTPGGFDVKDKETGDYNPNLANEKDECNISKAVTAIVSSLGAVTLILLIVTIALMARAVVTNHTRDKTLCEERNEAYSNLGQPKALSRKY